MMSKRSAARWARALLVLAVLCAVAILPVYGQSTSGSILGTVSDNSGAVMPGASVTATNLGTSDKRTAETDAAGNYRFVNLAPGRYRVESEVTGFKHMTRDEVVVQVESAVRIDLAMEIGAVTETVEVTSQTPLLQTENSSLGQVVEAKTVQEMPLNGRNVLNLIALVPGVIPQGSTAGAIASNQSAGHTNNNAWNNYQIGGGIAGHGASWVDGVPMIGLGGNTVTLVITQDAIQEFRVVTNNVSAEFGRFGGGVVNMATKSGANDLHGTVYEYFRNKALNASNFFANLAGQPKPAFNQNQYGAAVGGPVRKDKTFFFGSFERYKARVGATTLTFVPTLAQRAGDFSANAPIYDPWTTTVVNGKPTRTPFAGNRIPVTRFDQTANVIANKENYWRDPNASLSGGNFTNSPTPGGKSYQFNGRGDQTISDKQRLFARFSYWNLADIPMNNMGNLTAGAGSNQRTHQAVLGDTYAASPTTVVDLRLAFTRAYYDDRPIMVGRDMSVYGAAWASLQPQMTPTNNIQATVAGLYAFGGMTVNSEHHRDSYSLSPSLTKILGSHTLKFGADVRLLDYNFNQTANGSASSGTFNFDAGFTSADGTTAAAAGGNPFASFMLGTPSSGSLTTIRMAGQYSWYQGYYATDTFQVGKRLTLNLGVRWELPGAYSERYDAATVLLPNMTDSLAQSTGLPLKGGLALVNSPQWASRTTEALKKKLFAPRIGLAYRLDSSTVIRTGYGITFIPMDVTAGSQPSNSPINAASTTMSTSVNNAGQIPLNTLNNPYPAGGILGNAQQAVLKPYGRSVPYLESLRGLTISGPVPEQPYPYMQQWNFSIQREFRAGTLVEVAYGGSRSVHIPTFNINLNQLPNQYNSMGSALLTTVANPMAGKLNSTSPLNGANITQGQLLRPYPQYVTVQATNARLADTIYHALQVRLEKRFGDAGILTSNYTWSKNIGNSSGTVGAFLEGGQTVGGYQNYYDLRSERSLLNFDIPHRSVTSYVLEMPFGKGKKFLSSLGGPASKIVSGWAVNGIVTFQSGNALSISAQNTTLSQSFGAGTPRPNVVAGCNPVLEGTAQERRSKWFNTACFTQPSSYTFGNESRVDPKLRGAGINNFDFTITKNTAITERFRLQFKTEFFNIFNRAQFRVPATTLGLGTFGVVSAQLNQPRQIQAALRLTF